MRGPRSTASVLVLAFVLASGAGCFGTGFKATGTQGFLLPGYNYDGAGVRSLAGTLNVSLDPGKNSGEVVVDVRDAVHAYHLEMRNFSSTEAYQSGGVAKDVELFGATGNGGPRFPQVHALVAAFGTVTSTRDGRVENDPTNLYGTLPAVFFLARGHYRDNETHRVYAAEDKTLYDPGHPERGFVEKQGAQAALLVMTARGDLYRYVEFNEIRVLAS